MLLVEDELLIRELMAESLSDAGLEVVEVADGGTALEVLRSPTKLFTLLVTDYHMPGHLNGSHVAAAARIAFPSLPVIIASGRPDVFQASWQYQLGYRFLKKPYLPSALVALANALIERPSANISWS